MRFTHKIHHALMIGVLTSLIAGCGPSPIHTAHDSIPNPTIPHWVSIWVPQTHQYVWATPTTTPMLLVKRQDIAAGQLLQNRLEHLQNITGVGIVLTNPPPLKSKHISTIMAKWKTVKLPLGYLVGQKPPRSPITWIIENHHHHIIMLSHVPSLTQLSQELHAKVLPNTPVTPTDPAKVSKTQRVSRGQPSHKLATHTQSHS